MYEHKKNNLTDIKHQTIGFYLSGKRLAEIAKLCR